MDFWQCRKGSLVPGLNPILGIIIGIMGTTHENHTGFWEGTTSD